MEHNTDRILWTVLILAIGVALYVGFRPAANGLIHQGVDKIQTVATNVKSNPTDSSSSSGGTVDFSSDSDFIYSDPDTANDTISIIKYKGNKEDVTIPTYRKIGLSRYKVTAIEDGAFYENTSIKQVTILDGLRTIEAGAFLYASNLKSLTLGSDVTSIGDVAFEGTALTSVDFPASVTSIGYQAFEDTPISAISFRKCVDLGWGSFTHTNLKNVTLPTGSTYNGNTFDANAIQQVFDPNVMVTVK